MDCLITKLKGAVNDDSLLKLGELRLKITSISGENSQSIRVGTLTEGVTLSLKIIGGGHFTDLDGSENYGTTKDVTTAETLYISNGNYYLSITSKYELSNLSVLTDMDIVGGLEELKFSDKLISLSLEGSDVSGDLSLLSGFTNLYNLYLTSSQVTGNISSLSGLTKLQTLNMSELLGVEGDISVFQNMASLQTLNLYHTNVTGNISSLKSPLNTLSINGLNLTGTIEGLVTAQRSAGRNTGSIQTYGWPSAITFNGDAPENNTISWTSTQITCGDTTITA